MIASREIRITLPTWVGTFLSGWLGIFQDDPAAMELAVALARENVRQGGGPFGAVLLETTSGRLAGVGVNRVVASHCSLAHAELVAIASAQQALGGYDLSRVVPGCCTLVSSAEPCAMCMGAIPWAGIGRLVCGARDQDARAAGFDEGDKPADWALAYARRGIAVTRDCLRAQAAAVLADYAESDGVIYGPRPR